MNTGPELFVSTGGAGKFWLCVRGVEDEPFHMLLIFALQLGSWYGEGHGFFCSSFNGGIVPGEDFFSSFRLFSAALSS